MTIHIVLSSALTSARSSPCRGGPASPDGGVGDVGAVWWSEDWDVTSRMEPLLVVALMAGVQERFNAIVSAPPEVWIGRVDALPWPHVRADVTCCTTAAKPDDDGID